MKLTVLSISLTGFLFAGTAGAAKSSLPFELLTPLPKIQAARTAIVAGAEGRPLPERWTVVVHDSKASAGIREYMIAGGEIISQRATSELTEAVKSGDVLGLKNIKIFPPQLAALAEQYARANGAALGPIDYLLKKEGADAAPLWTVTCRDEAGAALGVLIVTAGKGQVISHEGFAQEPAPTIAPEVAAADAEFLENGETSVAQAETDESVDSGEPTQAKSKKKSSSRGSNGSTVSRPFRKVGGKLQKFFTGRDTISR